MRDKKALYLQEIKDILENQEYMVLNGSRVILKALYLEMLERFYIQKVASSMNVYLCDEDCKYTTIYDVWIKYIMTHSTLEEIGIWKAWNKEER